MVHYNLIQRIVNINQVQFKNKKIYVNLLKDCLMLTLLITLKLLTMRVTEIIVKNSLK
jgi:hypothetical protein